MLGDVTGSEAVHSVETILVHIAPLLPNAFLEDGFRDNVPCVHHLQVMAIVVAKTDGTHVAHEEAAKSAVENVLDQFQQSDGDLGLVWPGGGEPLVHAAAQTGRNPHLDDPGTNANRNSLSCNRAHVERASGREM